MAKKTSKQPPVIYMNDQAACDFAIAVQSYLRHMDTHVSVTKMIMGKDNSEVVAYEMLLEAYYKFIDEKGHKHDKPGKGRVQERDDNGGGAGKAGGTAARRRKANAGGTVAKGAGTKAGKPKSGKQPGKNNKRD